MDPTGLKSRCGKAFFSLVHSFLEVPGRIQFLFFVAVVVILFVCLFSSFQKLPGFLGLWLSSSLSKLAKIKLSPYIILLWTLPYSYLWSFCLRIIKPLWLHWVWPIIQNDLFISSEINHICTFALAISKVTSSQLLEIRMWTSLGPFFCLGHWVYLEAEAPEVFSL